jgi:hypothetical protein
MDAVCLPTVEALRDYVLKTLCDRGELDPKQAPLFQSLLRRSGRTCGLYFAVQGPRRVRLEAIWAGEEGRLLFYDSNGLRFGEARLVEGPDPLKLAG